MGSSASASSVVGLVAGAVKNLVIDMAVVLQVRRLSGVIPTASFHHSGSRLISCLLLVTEAPGSGLETPFERHLCGGAGQQRGVPARVAAGHHAPQPPGPLGGCFAEVSRPSP